MRVLIVESEKTQATLLSLLLGHAGYEVQVVHDCREALSSLEEGPVDLILLDLLLPALDGFVAMLLIKKDFPRIPILALAPRSIPTETCLKAGADEVLRKPYNARILLDKVRQTTERLLNLPEGFLRFASYARKEAV